MSLVVTRLPEMIGLVILHSLWQITLLWMVLVAVLRFLPRASSELRYILAISTLILSVLATAGTAVHEWQSNIIGEGISVVSHRTADNIETIYITAKQTVSSKIVDILDASVPMLAWLWCAGLVVMGARFGGSFFYLRRLRAQENIAAISPVWQQELKRLSCLVDLRSEVAIATSSRISSPLTMGSISPIILIPSGLLSGLSTAQIEAILVHELYHIKRHDYLINICQALVEVLLFYHPAIWHINKIIREERENCCDDQTVSFCGDAMAYARALTQLQEINTSTKPTLAMSATGPHAGNFSNRIKRLFNIYPNPAQARSKGIFAVSFLIVYLCFVLASVNVSTALPVDPKKKMSANTNDRNTLNTILSESIPDNKPSDVLDERKITKHTRSVTGENVRFVDMQHADTTVRERSLDNCLKQVRLMLQTVKFYKFSLADSFEITDRMDYLKLPPARFYGTLNPWGNHALYFIDTAGNEATRDVILEETPGGSADSIAINNDDSEKKEDVEARLKSEISTEEFIHDVAVQVFPNSTHNLLTIRFTPAHNNSRVKMSLVDSIGQVVKEITDSSYESIPTELRVDVSAYRKGIYILQINIDGAKSQQRVVVN
jgi:beta-lactamase regulating signal transducer with metallopeptidase domain